MRYLILMFFSISILSASASFLTPDKAFSVSAVLDKEQDKITATITPAVDIYVYHEKVGAKIIESPGITIDDVVMDEAVDHHGEQVYLKAFDIEVDLLKGADVTGMRSVTVEISYQGCSEQGLCYEPLTRSFTFDVDSDKIPLVDTKKSEMIAHPPHADEPAKKVVSETDQIAETIKTGSIGLILLTFFGFGLLLSLTPCVFPMIPILSSVIVSQGSGLTVKRAFVLSLVYVLAMSVAYTIAGILAGLFGANLQAAFQTPWVIISFSLIFVALSLSMFGMYELQLPNALQSRLTKSSEGHGGVVGVAIMGFLSALIVGPCVAAPLAGALIYIGQTGDALIGGMALFALSIGMGVPLLIVGTSAGKFMPRPGEWMENVKGFFGILLLGVAIWMISRVVPEPVTLLLWSSLVIFTAIHLGALEPLGRECRRCGRASVKALGVLLFLYGLMLFIGGFTGATNPLNPLERMNQPQDMLGSVRPAQAQASSKLPFMKIHSVIDLEEILAESEGKRVMLDFYADWCVACKELEHETFSDPDVIDELEEYVLIQADVTANSEDEKELSKEFGVFGPPAIIFFDEMGQQMEGQDLIGFHGPEEFIDHLDGL